MTGDDVLIARSRIMRSTGQWPATFRCHPATWDELRRAAMDAWLPDPSTTGDVIFGMRVVEDEGLEPWAWRLLDEFDTLLYDSRMGALP